MVPPAANPIRPRSALIQIKERAGAAPQAAGMSTVIFRCPRTGFNVQGWMAEETPAEAAAQVFVSVPCSACGQAHLVDPASGAVLGGDSPPAA